ncbi:DUF4349 domain-containing protein [Nocardia thailandica]
MRKVAVVLVGLLGLLLLAGCGGEETSSDSAGSGTAPTVRGPAAAAPGLREQSPKDSPAPTVTADRKEVVTGSVSITAGDPIAAAATIAGQVTALNGRIDSRTEQPGTGTGDSKPSASLTVRVPADRTDGFLDGLGSVGTVTRVTTNRDDVTQQWQDLDARIRALQTSVDRLRTLMSQATDTADLLAAEQALSSRQGELDSLTSQKRLLDDQVALSTLTLSITTDKPVAREDDSFWGGVVAGWHGLLDWLHDAVVFVGKAIPWLGFFAVIGALLWLVVRPLRRRRRARAAANRGTVAGPTGADSAAPGGSAASGAGPAGGAPDGDGGTR